MKWQFFQEKNRIFRCKNTYFSKISENSRFRYEMTIFSKIKKKRILRCEIIIFPKFSLKNTNFRCNIRPYFHDNFPPKISFLYNSYLNEFFKKFSKFFDIKSLYF